MNASRRRTAIHHRYLPAAGARYDIRQANFLGCWMADMDANGQPITPQELVDEATPASSSLHSMFEWNDAAAGAAYRLHQARHHISHLRIETHYEDGEVTNEKAWHSLPLVVTTDDSAPDPEIPRRYFSVESVTSNWELNAELQGQLRRELRSIRDKYKKLVPAVFQPVWDAIDQL